MDRFRFNLQAKFLRLEVSILRCDEFPTTRNEARCVHRIGMYENVYLDGVEIASKKAQNSTVEVTLPNEDGLITLEYVTA